jgi:Ca2+-dependent lipid-binding protein
VEIPLFAPSAKKDQGKVVMQCELVAVPANTAAAASGGAKGGAVGSIQNSSAVGGSAKDVAATAGAVNLAAVDEFSLRIRKIQARSLANAEMIGKNDPFIELKVGEIMSWKTNTLKDSGSEGIWVYPDTDASQMIIPGSRTALQTATLAIKVYDENDLRSNQLIGEAQAPLAAAISAVSPSGFGEFILPFQLKNKGKDAGTVEITIGVAAVLPSSMQKPSADGSKPGASSKSASGGEIASGPPFDEGELRINWIKCFDLKNVEKMSFMGDKNDPFVALRLGSWEAKTETLDGIGSNPEWENLYLKTDITADIISDEQLKIQVFDANTTGAVIIGSADAVLYNAVATENLGKEVELSVILKDAKGATTGRAVIGVVVKRHEAQASKDVPIAEGFTNGLLVVTKITAIGLKNTELMGKQDPYIKLIYGQAPPLRTITQDNAGAAATWDFLDLNFEVSAETLISTPLTVEAWDENSLKDTKIGSGSISVRRAGSKLENPVELEVDLVGSDEKSAAGTLVLTCKVVKKAPKADLSAKVAVADGLTGIVTVTRVTVTDVKNTELIGKQVYLYKSYFDQKIIACALFTFCRTFM